MAKREFLMLAHSFSYEKHNPASWFLSVKLDGMRAMWDGGITRGLHVKDIPFANTEKDYIRVNQDIRATGLWSRGGKVIYAPDWWINNLPPFPLDGELYAGKNNFQMTMSIAKDLIPSDYDWQVMKFMVFDSPWYSNMFADGEVDFRTHKKQYLAVDGWAQRRASELGIVYPFKTNYFETLHRMMKKHGFENNTVEILDQVQLPFSTSEAKALLDLELDKVTATGGEGLMLRKASSIWIPERSHHLLKVKKWQDAEATVIGYTWGRKTTKGSKLLGLMGAMILQMPNGKIFELSGFTDAERALVFKSSGNSARDFGARYAGERVDANLIHNPKFPIGTVVTYRYRELTDGGLPKEARYWRIRNNL